MSDRRKKWMRRFRYWLSLMAEPRFEADTSTPIDVVIPVIEKDLNTLPLCIEGIRRCIVNPIAAIYLVGPDHPAIREAAASLEVEWVDETSLMGFDARSLNLITADGTNRSGWLFQQLIKLSGKVGQSRYYLTIDADHVLLKPHKLLDKQGRTIFYRSKEYHPPYYHALQSMLGVNKPDRLSYVAHKMLFDREMVVRLQRELENRSDDNARWHEVILDKIDRKTMSGFSEFETYGHFVPREKKMSLPWRQKTLRTSPIGISYQQLKNRYGKWWRSVTFPDYLQ